MEDKKTKPSSSSSPSPSNPTQLQSQRPWLDLPDGVTELVLERLPLSDYVRFPAVCRRWRSIQKAHRLRHSPGPPPMRPLTWLVVPTQEPSPQDSAVCYSPFEQRLYRFHLVVGDWRCLWRCLGSSRGWLLLKEDYPYDSVLSLLNPVSGVRIQLPDLPYGIQIDFGCMSDDLDLLVVMAADDDKVFLWRAGTPQWGPLPPLGGGADHDLVTAIFCGGRFYIVSSKNELFEVDPSLSSPAAIKLLYMNWNNVSFWNPKNSTLVESGGQVLLLNLNQTPGCRQALLELFRADLSAERWVRVQSLGDRAIFLNHKCAFSLLAAGVGVRKNCVYLPEAVLDKHSSSVSWKGYDLHAGVLMDGEPIPITITDLDCFGAMTFGLNFEPSLDAFDPGAASVDAMVSGSSSD